MREPALQHDAESASGRLRFPPSSLFYQCRCTSAGPPQGHRLCNPSFPVGSGRPVPIPEVRWGPCFYCLRSRRLACSPLCSAGRGGLVTATAVK